MNHLFIDDLLSPYQTIIGKHYPAYRNHVHRVYNLSLSFKENLEEEDPTKFAIASVFHDIGLWTKQTFDYLEPSSQELHKYLINQGQEQWQEEISLMIHQHHKIRPYQGAFADNVEALRKADLVDLTHGWIRLSLNTKLIQENYVQYPVLDFRRILILMFGKNLLKNPLKPMPMLKS